ncbi:MAG: nitroreductase family protein [Spirochaetota bacterium]
MDTIEAIRRRASYRGAYTDQPVPREDLERIAEAGLIAPSGHNGQSTSFVIVTDRTLLAELVALTSGKECLRTAKAIIVVVMDPHATDDKEFAFGVEDYAAATENMLLAITSMGYASVWLDGELRRNDVAARIGQLLGVPPEREVRVLLPVGVPAEQPRQRPKRGFGERAWFERFGGEAG